MPDAVPAWETIDEQNGRIGLSECRAGVRDTESKQIWGTAETEAG